MVHSLNNLSILECGKLRALKNLLDGYDTCIAGCMNGSSVGHELGMQFGNHKHMNSISFFFFFLAASCGLWDLSSPTRD